MILKLKVEEDAELRGYVKDLIKGQVVSFMRSEFYEVVNNAVTKEVEKCVSRAVHLLEAELRPAAARRLQSIIDDIAKDTKNVVLRETLKKLRDV